MIFYSIIAVVSFYTIGAVNAQDATRVIPLSKSTTFASKQLYNEYITVNATSTVEVTFSDINQNISFIIFQVHSQFLNVTVYNNTLTKQSSVVGTNIGLYSSVNPIDTFYIHNQNEVNVKLMISILGYTKNDPIPGGCNMEFPVPISPFMKLDLQKEMVLVNAAPAMYMKDKLCKLIYMLDFSFFMMYLPETDMNEETYFDGIRRMSTLEGIRENGVKIPRGIWRMRRIFSLYAGTGAVYVAVASVANNSNYYSVYIPAVTYGCSTANIEGCGLIDDFFTKCLCAGLLFLGILVTYFGHYFFKTGLFLSGVLGGFIVAFILYSIYTNLDSSILLFASLLTAVFFGAIWLTFWWYYGIPVIAVTLPALNMGFLISSIMYNKLPGDLPVLEEDFNFWSLFILVMCLVAMILVSVAFISNVLCCAVLGAFAVVYPIDFYLGSNVKYIIINTIRRAVVPRFNRALLMAPFEWRDTMVIALWIVLAVSGLLFQHYHNRGRPPFPPPPRSLRRRMPRSSGYGALPSNRNILSVGASSEIFSRGGNERTPLLS